MKDCNRCKIVKPLSEFYTHRLAKDGHDPRCKACKVEVARLQRREWKLQAIADKGDCCSVCGETYPAYVYDFHHTNDDKELSPGDAPSKAAFFREVEKCDLVCANCHRILHHSEPF